MYDFKPMGDRGILISFEQVISPETALKIQQFISKVEAERSPSVVEIIPAYATVCVIYDPFLMDYGAMEDYLSAFLDGYDDNRPVSANVFEIPVLYNKTTGPDLSFISERSGLSVDEIIAIHTSCEYLIYMLGFVPGFPYLGGMDERIAAPRLKVPRQKIVPGSVGIAGAQTGMYPIESPGGWQLIGQTPVKLYDPLRTPPVHYSAGDYIKHTAIDEAEFSRIQELEKNGGYEVKTWLKS